MDTISRGTSPLTGLVIFCIVLAFIGTLVASAVVIVAPAQSQLPTPPTNGYTCTSWCGEQYTPGTAEFDQCYKQCVWSQYSDA
jgi:hypothetical protein